MNKNSNISTGDKRQQLREAIINAFPTQKYLEMFLNDVDFEKNLSTIAGGENYTQVVYELIKHSEANNKLEQLVEILCQARPRNKEFRQVRRKLCLKLPYFDFEVATIQVIPKPEVIRRRTRLIIDRQKRQNLCFIENLGNGVQIEMVKIPSGSFIMGASKTEVGSKDYEYPQHQVTIPAFFMSKYPVTQKQWQEVATLPRINGHLEVNPSYFRGDKRPVEQVSWYDAVEFCARLSNYTGIEYRLPSEAEWEYACRAGTTTPFHFGETITSDLVNYDANYTYGAGVRGVYQKETTQVGSLGVANAFGLYDMHGQLWEWCADIWHDNYQGAPTDGSAWIDSNESDNQTQRPHRGGSWGNKPELCRSASRERKAPGDRYDGIGMRIVCNF